MCSSDLGRGGRSGDGAELMGSGGAEDALLPQAEESGAADQGSRRQEPEMVVVPMDDNQELVYGWMGLSPALLLESPPPVDNLLVRVARPGTDPEMVLEEARQQLVAGGSRRRRRGRGGSELRGGSGEIGRAHV